MATVLPTDRGAELQSTRISGEPPAELPAASSRRAYGPGDCIDGKYLLESLLGQGGMGEVWTARNETLGVRRAVKLIRADAGSAESTDRLLHEAQAAARLADPSIVRVFDFGKTGAGDPYIVMELLEGEDLLGMINRRERLSPTKAARVLLPLIRALGAAHAHGIIHRDLKPENIFLAKLPDGRVQPKLLDFGIAKLKNARELRLTTAGAVMGSPLYMAPEQGRGEEVDERVDVWAMCVVLYEAITGSPPFGGDDRAQVMRAVADQEPKSLSEHGVSDTSIWPIIVRGLQKNRDDRFRTMDELGRALATWLLDSGVVDDITGASLQAGWFKTSRHSLFASSLPPERQPGRMRRGFSSLLTRVQMSFWLLSAQARSVATALERRTRPQRVAFGAVVTAGALVAFALLGGAASKPHPTRWNTANPASRAKPAARVPPRGSPVVDPPKIEAPPDGTQSSSVTAPPAAPPALEAPRRAIVRKTPSAQQGSRDRVEEERRSKLIDPYQ